MNCPNNRDHFIRSEDTDVLVSTVSFLGFTLLVAVISYVYTRRDRMTTWDAYFLGGRSLSAWVIAGSLMLTNLRPST